jgi:hypothetical protein
MCRSADAPTLSAKYSSARGRADPLPLWICALLTGCASPPHRAWRGLCFASLKHCVKSPVVRPCLPPVRRAQHHAPVCCKTTRAWRTGFYHGSELPRCRAPALRFAPVLCCRCPRDTCYGLRLVGVFGRVPTQALSPRRWRGGISLGPSLIYIACWSICVGGISLLWGILCTVRHTPAESVHKKHNAHQSV